jgi:hypothetical protein
MNQQRLEPLAKNLELLYEKLADFEQDLILSYSTGQKFSLKQKIKREILPDIQKYEAEYWDLMTQDAIFVYDEQAAEDSLRDVEASVKEVEVTPSLPEDVVELLKQIRDILNTPKKRASAKLKLALPLIPSILSYDIEIDTSKKLYKVMDRVRQKKILKSQNPPNKT